MAVRRSTLLLAAPRTPTGLGSFTALLERELPLELQHLDVVLLLLLQAIILRLQHYRQIVYEFLH